MVFRMSTSFLHVLEHGELVLAVGVFAAGAQVRAGQAHEGEPRAVGAAADRDDVRLHAVFKHRGLGGLDDLHVRQDLFLHVVVGVLQLDGDELSSVLAVQEIRGKAEFLLAVFKERPVVVADDVVERRVLDLALHADEVREALVALGVLRHLVLRQEGGELHRDGHRVDHLVFCAAGVDAEALDRDVRRSAVEVLVLELAEVAAVRLGESLGPAAEERSDDLGSVCGLVRSVLLSGDGSDAAPSLPEEIPWDAVWLIRVLGTGLGKFSVGLIEGMPTAWRRAASANGALRPHAAAPKVPASQGGPGKTRKPVDLRLLGGFELRVRGVLVADWKLERRNAKAMLEYLVLHGGSARRYQLVDQVWPDSDYTSGFNRAYQAASVLRKEIAEIDPNLSLLMSSRTSGEVVIDTNIIGCDVDAFRSAAREAVDSRDDARKLEFARAAERLYAGDLYVPTLDATGFISSMRDSLRGLYADAMVEGSAAALRLGHERTATRLAENAVRANELREDANSTLVRALRACGRGMEADGRLRSFEARLRRGRGEPATAHDETADR